MSLIRILLQAVLLAGICAGQSTTPAPTASCNYCYLAPGYTDISSSNEEYLLFTAYSLTSAFTQDGFCFTVSGASSSLPTPYSVAKPATATADPSQYSSAAASWFVSFLNAPDWGVCGKDGSLTVHMADAKTTQSINVAVPTVLGAVSRTSLLSASNTAGELAVTPSSQPTKGLSGLGAGAKAAIGVALVVGVLGLLVPGVVLLVKYRNRKQRRATEERIAREKLGMETETESGFERQL